MAFLAQHTSGRQGLMDDTGYDFYETEPAEELEQEVTQHEQQFNNDSQATKSLE